MLAVGGDFKMFWSGVWGLDYPFRLLVVRFARADLGDRHLDSVLGLGLWKEGISSVSKDARANNETKCLVKITKSHC